MRKRFLAAVLLVSICLSLSACARRTQAPVITEPPVTEPVKEVQPTAPPVVATPVISTATSESAKLYAYAMSNGYKYVVDDYGRYARNYSFDVDDNIVDADGTLAVPAESVKMYKPIRTMYFGKEVYTLSAEGTGDNPAAGYSAAQVYSNCVVELYCAPASATSGVVCVRSDSTAVVEIRPNSNAKFVSITDGTLAEGEVALKADDLTQPVQIYIRVLTNETGEANIHARTLDSTVEAECRVTVEVTAARQRQNTTAATDSAGRPSAAASTPTPTPIVSPIVGATEFVNASGKPSNHIHTYRKNVISPTTVSMGYTEYICTICGYSYQDEFTSKLAPSAPAAATHVHSYHGVPFPASETEQGYTLYICDGCGDSYKADFTPPLAR